MAIAQVPQRIALAAGEKARELRDRASVLSGNDKRWTRPLAVSSLITGAILLARGKRKAGFVAVTAGAAIALLEDPKDMSALWENVPAYLQQGKRFLGRLEEFVEDLSDQGGRWKSLLEKIERR